MTDLPRFTGGSLGPLTHAQINEVMRRLDALQPLIESASVIEQDLRNSNLAPRIVYAKKTHAKEYPKRFKWRDPIVTDDSVLNFDSEGWDDVSEEFATKGGDVVDDLGEETEDYAIATVDFVKGFATCFITRSVDGKRKYVLTPLPGADFGAAGGLFVIGNSLGEGEPIVLNDKGSIQNFVYTASRCNFGLVDGNYKVTVDSEVIPFFHIGGPEGRNIPSVTGNPGLEPRPLDVGTFFTGSLVNVSLTSEPQLVGYITDLVRLNVEC